MIYAYLQLTKPRISVLFAITGLAALILEGSFLKNPFRLWMIVLAIFLVGGSANGLNQYFERDVDQKMARTAKKRPLPQGLISPRSALLFSLLIGVIGNLILWKWGTPLSFWLGVATILFYSFYYTLWLKPRTPYNIVIGGAAGAAGPLIAWAAATGHLSWVALFMFLIVFFWTPPHFWALALCCKEDYAKVGYPMLPLVKGDEKTRQQIVIYSVILLPMALSLFAFKVVGWVYLINALLLTVGFIVGAIRLYLKKTTKVSWQFFGYSIVYLLLLFGMMIVDGLL